KLSEQLRREGIPVGLELMERGLSAQLKHAARIGAKFTIIIGESELERDIVLVKNMETGEQVEFEKSFVVSGIKDMLTENI
ncbi:MAG: His/Gly/Thr/Pro-type tRNA ligase C-terminal domain-containing protein, partial [Candidatus Aenigmatarchaeota archaeon]